MSFITILADAAPTATPSFFANYLFLPLLVASMWFLLIAPQRKKQKQHSKMIQALTTGDDILTAGGIYGTITNVKDDRFVIKISDNTKIELNKASIQAKLSPTKEESKK